MNLVNISISDLRKVLCMVLCRETNKIIKQNFHIPFTRLALSCVFLLITFDGSITVKNRKTQKNVILTLEKLIFIKNHLFKDRINVYVKNFKNHGQVHDHE